MKHLLGRLVEWLLPQIRISVADVVGIANYLDTDGDGFIDARELIKLLRYRAGR